MLDMNSARARDEEAMSSSTSFEGHLLLHYTLLEIFLSVGLE